VDSFSSFANYRDVRTAAYASGGAGARCQQFFDAAGVHSAVQVGR
jgi:hypothetical protein